MFSPPPSPRKPAPILHRGGGGDQGFRGFVLIITSQKPSQKEREINEMSCLLLIYLFIFSLLIFQI